MKYLILCIAISFISCKGSSLNNYEEMDLLAYGMPVSIMAPVGATATKQDYGVMLDVVVKGERYEVQIYSSNTTTLDINKIKQQKLNDVKLDRYFSKIIEEEENGFIFEKNIDENIRFDFRYIKVIGDKEFTFQKGLTGNFSESEIRSMYEAVK